MSKGIILFLDQNIRDVVSGAGFEPGHISRHISSLYDENALVQTSRDRCGFGGQKNYKDRI